MKFFLKNYLPTRAARTMRVFAAKVEIHPVILKEKDRMVYLPKGIERETPIYEELFNLNEDVKDQNNFVGIRDFAMILE